MGAALRHLLTENYEAFGSMMSPSLSGGLVNYLLEPKQDANNETILIPAKFEMVEVVKEYFLSKKQNLKVYDVLPAELKVSSIRPRTYFEAMVAGGVAIVLAFLFFLITLIIPCVFKCGKLKDRKVSVSKAKRISYIILGIIITLLVAYLVFCLPIAFFATEAFVSTVSAKGGKDTQPELIQKFELVIDSTEKFLRGLSQNGTSATNEALVQVKNKVNDTLVTAIGSIVDKLLERFGVDALINQTEAINETVVQVDQTFSDLVAKVDDVVAKFTSVKNTLGNFTPTITKSLQTLCADPLLITQQTRCNGFQNSLPNPEINIDTKQITDPIAAIATATTTMRTQMDELANTLDGKQDDIDRQLQNVITQINDQIDLADQFGPINTIWEELEQNAVDAVVPEMRSILAQMQEQSKMIGLIGSAVGYTLFALLAATVFVMFVYLILCWVDACLRGFWPCKETNESHSLTLLPACGFLLPVLTSLLTPIIVLLGVLFVLITSVANNEGCRYFVKPNAINMSDAVIHLFLKGEWPTLKASLGIEPDIEAMLNLRPPEHALYGLLVDCKQNSSSLLPLLGIANLINASVLTNRPEITNALTQNEAVLLNEIRNLDLQSILAPIDLATLRQLITDMTSGPSATTFQHQINQMINSFPNQTELQTHLNQLRNFSEPLASRIPAAATIVATVDETERELAKIDPIRAQLRELSNDVTVLDQFDHLPAQLTAFVDAVDKMKQLLSNQTAVETIARELYRSGTSDTLTLLEHHLTEVTERFTQQVASCGDAHSALSAGIGLGCGPDGLIGRLGSYFFSLLLVSLPSLFTMVLFQIFLGFHLDQCNEM